MLGGEGERQLRRACLAPASCGGGEGEAEGGGGEGEAEGGGGKQERPDRHCWGYRDLRRDDDTFGSWFSSFFFGSVLVSII